MCVTVCVCWGRRGEGERGRYLGGGGFYRSPPVEGEIKVCCCLCVPELQHGGDRHFLCLLGTTKNTGTRGARVKKERGGEKRRWKIYEVPVTVALHTHILIA